MSLSEWLEAFKTFLISPLSETSISSVLAAVPFETICSCCIHPQADDDLRETAQRVTTRLVTFQSISNTHIQTPFLRKLEGKADEGGDKLLDFIHALVTHEDEENKHLAKILLAHMLQVACINNALENHSTSQEPHATSNSALFVLSNLLHQVMMPLFDHDHLAYSNVVADSVLEAATGRVLQCLTLPSHMGVQNLEVEELCKKWHRQELDAPEKNLFVDWILRTELIKELRGRIKGDISLKAGRESSAVDVVRVRAGSLLIKITDLCAATRAQAESEDWMGLTIGTLYNTDDILLKLTAGELIIEELLKSEVGLNYVWTSKFYTTCLTDMKDESLDIALNLALLRLVSNIVEKVPGARPTILADPSYLNAVKVFVDAVPSDPNYISKKTSGLSALGCVASKLNVEGLTALDTHMPEWLHELELSLRSGTESELMAALMATARILGGIEMDQQPVQKEHPIIQKTLTVFADNLSKRIVECITLRPFPAPREVAFRLLSGFLSRGIRAPLETFCSQVELQHLLFAPPYADPAVVKYAKHEFVRTAVSLYKDWIKTNCSNSDFVKAVNSYAQHDAFFVPEEYRGSQVAVAEKFAE